MRLVAARRSFERMYTGTRMRRRSFAFLAALLVAVTPAISVVCASGCTPPSAATTPCHGGNGGDSATVHGAAHGCDHDHTGADPALLTSSPGREASCSPVATARKAEMAASLRYAGANALLAMHGPPGPSGRRTLARITILRI